MMHAILHVGGMDDARAMREDARRKHPAVPTPAPPPQKPLENPAMDHYRNATRDTVLHGQNPFVKK